MVDKFSFKVSENFNKRTDELFAHRNHEGTSDVQEILGQLQDLSGQRCKDDYERYQLLDNRDKLLCSLRQVSPSLFGRTGTCPNLCPEKERYVRIVQKRLSMYECDHFGKLIHHKAVKEYARSAADQERPLPHELRSGPLLEKAMDYLLVEVIDSNPRPDQLPSWYDFLWSRTRAIRKEITQQMIVDPKSVSIVQKCARFHIFASYALCTLGMGEFDQRMNTENIGKSLQTLRHLYEDLAKQGIGCKDEAEFRSYDIMMHLDDTNTTTQALSYRKEVRESEPVRLALQLAATIQNGNYARFFRLLRTRATFLQICACHRYFDRVRVNAYRVMVRSYGRNASLGAERVAFILGFDTVQQLAIDASLYGLQCNEDELDLNRDSFSGRPTEAPVLRLYSWIDAKMHGFRLSQILTGGILVTSPHVDDVIDSFDEDGYYIKDPVLGSFINMKAAAPPIKTELVSKPSTQEPTQFTFHSQPIERKIAKWNAHEQNKTMVSNVCNEFFSLEAPPLFERKLHVAVANALSNLVEAKSEQHASNTNVLVRQQLMEANRRQQILDRQQQLREEAGVLLPQMFLDKVQMIVDEHIMALHRQLVSLTLQKVRLEFEKRLFNQIWKRFLLEFIDSKTKEIVTDMLLEAKTSQQTVIDGVRERLSLLWLRQFWDQWRNVAVARRQEREQYKKLIEEWPPCKIVFLPNVTKMSLAVSRRDHDSSFVSSWRRYSDGIANQQDSNLFAQQKRKKPIAYKYFHRWRLNAQKRATQRKIAEGFISRKRKACPPFIPVPIDAKLYKMVDYESNYRRVSLCKFSLLIFLK